MGELKLYQDIKNARDDDERFQIIAHAIEANRQPDLSELATKQDISDLKAETKKDILELKVDIAEMKSDIFKAMNEMTWKFVGALAILGVVFKLAEMYLPHR